MVDRRSNFSQAVTACSDDLRENADWASRLAEPRMKLAVEALWKILNGMLHWNTAC